MVGALLRQVRAKSNLSLKEISDKTGIPEDQLQAYEKGEYPIPLPTLEILVNALGGHLDLFMDQSGLVGTWRKQQQAIQHFLELPEEMREFIGKPVNQPYLELARRLSDLSVERLRSVAEGLLEITY
jgi:transcriptional regulator with XRE-family HTH domain